MLAIDSHLDLAMNASLYQLRRSPSEVSMSVVDVHAHYHPRAYNEALSKLYGRPVRGFEPHPDTDDNAHIEQKNWTHVRKLLGYVRYDRPAAVVAIHALYRHELRLLQNLFLPSVKLLRKTRVQRRKLGK